MPPKGSAALGSTAAAPVPAIPVVSPHVVEAQKVVDKWAIRYEDVLRRMKENDELISNLSAQRASREAALREGLSEVSVICLPKPPEQPEAAVLQTASKVGKTSGLKKAAEAVPPPPPPPDDDEIKKLAKLQNAVISIYRKKRDKIVVRDVPDEQAVLQPSAAADEVRAAAGEQSTEVPLPPPPPPIVEESGITKPGDLAPHLWARVLKLRDERIDNEEKLAINKSNMDIAESRRQALETIEKVVLYSLDAARFDLDRAKEAKGSPGAAPSSPQRPPSNAAGKQIPQRPPSQLLRR